MSNFFADSKLLERVATYKTVADFASFLSILPDPDPVLRKRGSGLALYRETIADAHVYACMQSRKTGTRKLPWALEPAGEDPTSKRIHAFVEDNLRRLDMNRINGEALDAPFWGFVPFELLWKADGLSVLLADVVGLPPEWFSYTPDGDLRFLTARAPLDGEPVEDDKFVLVRHDASYANPYGERVLSKCFWPATFKKGGLKFWFIFTEKYGMPWAIGRHSKTASNEDITDLLNSLIRLVQDAVATIPDDTSVELKDAASRASSAQIYNLLKQACDGEISKAILSQTLTTEIGDVGSKAAVMGHLEVRQDVLDSDRVLIESFWKSVISRLVAINFGTAALSQAPRFILVVKEAVAVSLEMAQRDAVLWKMGFPLDEADLARRHQVPIPAAGAKVLPPPPAGGASGFAEAPAGKTPWPLAALEPDAQAKAENAFAPLVAAFRREIERWRSYDDAGSLVAAVPLSARAPLTDYFHGLLVTGYLAGRADGVNQENRALSRGTRFAEAAPSTVYTPEAAITYFRNKVAMSPEEFAKLDEAARAKAFTMAGVENDNILAAVKKEVERAIAEGRPYGDFKASIDTLFDKAGVTRMANYRIAQVYGDNLASAYGAGAYDELHSPTAEAIFPYFRYRDFGVYDGPHAVRPTHRLNGTIVRRDDPWVQTHWGPWAYGCRCWMEGITSEEARGATIAKGDKLTGPDPSGFTCPAQGFLDVGTTKE